MRRACMGLTTSILESTAAMNGSIQGAQQLLWRRVGRHLDRQELTCFSLGDKRARVRKGGRRQGGPRHKLS